MRGAHKVAGNHHKAVNTRLTPHTEEKSKDRVRLQRIIQRTPIHPGINNRVMRHNQQHHDNPVEFQIRRSLG